MTSQDRYSPLWHLMICRFREFIRQPEAVFWTYGFPLIMILSLGLAFRSSEPAPAIIDVVEIIPNTGPEDLSVATIERLKQSTGAQIRHLQGDEADQASWQRRLQTGKTNLVIVPQTDGSFQFWYEPQRSESVLAKVVAESQLAKSAASTNMPSISEHRLEAVGSRYIDFLVPGMLAMNIMGGGLWGIGFLVVDARIRKLLKRLLATPMKRRDYLLSLMAMRLGFGVCEMSAILLFSYLVFGVSCRGNYIELVLTALMGGATFAGVGMLLASRAQTSEAISGLMKLVVLPMWIFGGVFFSYERFPEYVQWALKALPFVCLVDGLRGIMLEGNSMLTLWRPLLTMSAWGIVCFVVAIRIFRWK